MEIKNGKHDNKGGKTFEFQFQNFLFLTWNNRLANQYRISTNKILDLNPQKIYPELSPLQNELMVFFTEWVNGLIFFTTFRTIS